jgi:thiol-disulfide isomerase/thioredoxin
VRSTLSAAVLMFGCASPEIHEPAVPAKIAALDADHRSGILALEGTIVGSRGRSTIAELAGQERTAINFWATWCPPCLLEMPTLAALARDGKRIAGVSLDVVGANVEGTLKDKGAGYPNLIFDEPTLKRAGLLLDRGVPFTVIVEGGQITAAFAGPMQKAQLEAALDGKRE